MLRKKHISIICLTIVAIIAIVFSGFTFYHPNQIVQPGEPTSYLGVTYCGNSVAEAKQLIDKVKDYTNLFVLQTGTWERSPEKINAVCTYAVDAGMHFIVYFGSQHASEVNDWLNTLTPSLEQKCLGVYFGDEMGGKMLDSNVWLSGRTPYSINKYSNGTVSINLSEAGGNVLYQKDGSIVVQKFLMPQPGDNGSTSQYTTYYPNGSITCEIQPYNKARYEIENTNATPLSLPEIWSQQPLKTYDEAAQAFTYTYNWSLHAASFIPHPNKEVEIKNFTSFTSDYALYWFDYISGCDVVLAEIGWNQSLPQDIGLARGAATLQNKSWGAMITWKYTQPPYLDSGDAIYNQMRTAYQAGAKYIVVFNYAKDMTEAYGILQEEHFQALQRFWNDVVQKESVVHGGIKAEAVLVLPHNYGWGMRNPQDNIWGLWQPDEKAPVIWSQLQSRIAQYGTKLDIVYEDSAFPVQGKYQQIYYWNQTR